MDPKEFVTRHARSYAGRRIERPEQVSDTGLHCLVMWDFGNAVVSLDLAALRAERFVPEQVAHLFCTTAVCGMTNLHLGKELQAFRIDPADAREVLDTPK